MKPQLPFRLGSTSYVYPADILPNVRKLAPLVDDVELVLFEVDSQNNLPAPAVITELADLAAAHDLTYTVHLPLDLRLAEADSGRRHPSIDKARRVVGCTQELDPWAYVVHLDGADIISDGGPRARARWQSQAARSLELIAKAGADLQRLAVENLEAYAPDAFLPVVKELGISLCIDLGHFVKVGLDPLPYLEANITQTRVVHLHGCESGRDHQGLAQLPEGLLAAILNALLSEGYEGVLTLEVFSEQAFFPGRDLILSLVEANPWADN